MGHLSSTAFEDVNWPTYNPTVSAFLADALRDMDRDGVPDQVDKCNGSDDTIDADGDGFPEGCDSCYEAVNDADNDGFCDNGNPISVPDNCPTTRQKSLLNTNFEFEQVMQEPKKFWGDACDPVPTMRHKPVFQTLLLGGSETFQGEFTLSARASHKAPHLVTPTGCSGGYCTDKQTAVMGAFYPAHFRWCDKKNSLGQDCMLGPVLADEGSAVRLPPLNVAGETNTMLYHRILFKNANPSANDTFGRDKSLSYGHNDFDDSGRIKWDLAADRSSWIERGFLQGVDGSYNLEGNTWFHSESNTGKDASNDTLFGTQVGVHGVGLVNAVVAVNTTPIPGSSAPLPPSGVTINWLSIYASKLFEVTACIKCLPMFNDLGFDEVAFLTNDATHGPLLVRDDGLLRPVSNHLGTNLKVSLQDSSLRWVAGAEPDYAMGKTDVIAVALAANGSEVIEQASVMNGGLAGKGDRFQPMNSMMTIAEGRLPARTGWHAAFSRSLNRVFLVGGTLQGASTPSGEIWSLDLGTRQWSRMIYTNFAPQTVMAVTYSFADKSLYLVDQATGRSPKRRLVRLPLTSHEAVSLGSWVTTGSHDQVWLESDRGGDGVLLSCSSSSASNHTVVNVSTRLATTTVLEKLDGTGKLGVGLSANPGGYIRLKRGTGDVPVTDRARRLADLAGTYTANPSDGLASVGTCLQ
ncbi:MAG: hypothetical protein EOO70_01250 [Myxococcaceae bacterium]|nr:MAG: hypothetical protein EOO70_01250 [Myxococcaceae bacterium]